ncbi:hypothetical protein Anas_12537 [Armadillidium nasatum]|uniref:Uncharacterized protein n=1 Tax=Armadillidium nasatum TaxID=96803 RepID=A0A5N5SNK9_9CRUS|nr:hypothetical protein Anas_12537 [Armadillidium nasatum]
MSIKCEIEIKDELLEFPGDNVKEKTLSQQGEESQTSTDQIEAIYSPENIKKESLEGDDVNQQISNDVTHSERSENAESEFSDNSKDLTEDEQLKPKRPEKHIQNELRLVNNGENIQKHSNGIKMFKCLVWRYESSKTNLFRRHQYSRSIISDNSLVYW